MNNSTVKNQKIRLPMLLTCLYFLAVPLSIIPMPGGLSLLKVVTIGVVAVMIPLLFIGDNEIKLNGMHLAWTVYVIYSFSTLFLLREEISVYTFRGLLETTALAMLISFRVYNEREKRWIYNTWLIVGVIMIFLMLFASVSLAESDNRETVVLFGHSEDPNQISGYFLLPMIVCMERIINTDGKKSFRLFYIAFLLVMTYCIFRTGSRGGLAAIIGTVSVYVVLSVRGVKNRIITAVIIVVFIFILMFFIIPVLPESIMGRFNLNRIMEDRASNRFDIWMTLWNDLKNNIGSFTWGKGFYATAKPLAEAGIGNTVAHNHIIQVLYDQGIMGCLLFVIMIITGAVRTFKKERTVTVAVLGMMVLGMSLTLYPYYKPFWNVLIMTALNFAEMEEENA